MTRARCEIRMRHRDALLYILWSVRPSENRVLVIGDRRAMNTIARGLHALGYEPRAAASTVQARTIFSTWSLDPCAYALVDHPLDDGSGMDLLPELSALVPAPSVALISEFLSSDVAARAFKNRALPMAHPADVETLGELLEMLRRLRARSLESEGSSPPESTTSELSRRRAPEALVFDPFTLTAGRLRTPSGTYRLRSAEARLLAHLVRRRPNSVNLEELAHAVLGRDDDGCRRCIYSHVANLRVRLGRYAALIETEHKHGYRLILDAFEAR
jgi:DNA-binding response OmpR family regulator